MEAIIVEKIQIKKIDLKEGAPYYREAIRKPMTLSYLEEGKTPDHVMGVFSDINYERMTLNNPETREKKNYFVRVDDRKIWNDLVKVSDGFINGKIQEGIASFRENFVKYDLPKIKEAGFDQGLRSVKELGLFKRIFKRF